VFDISSSRKLTHLRNVSWGVQLNRRVFIIELIAVQIQEFHEDLTKVMLGDHASALDLWHILEKTYDKTGYRKSTDTSVDRLVETSHGKEMLDQCDENGHCRKSSLPFLECPIRDQASIIFEGHIDSETRNSVNKFDKRDFGLGDDFSLSIQGKVALFQEGGKFEETVLFTQNLVPALHVSV
jgi:hypothetical protein